MTSNTGDADPSKQRPATRLANAGRDPFAHHGYVNTPVYHASTLLYESTADYLAHRGRYQYARRGTPTSEALQNALAAIEGPQCAGVALLPSGLAAVSAALLSAVKAGDHVLVTDSVYGPTRKFCDTILTRYGISTTYYDPAIGAGIAALMKPTTAAVFVDSPGSLSFEMQDVPAIAAAARERGATVLMDNTWASPVYFRPLENGVDLAIQAGTKYIGGHSDVMLGVVAATKKALPRLNETVYEMGLCVGPDDMFLALRGLRTLGVRLAHQWRRHEDRALARSATGVPARAAPRARKPSGPRHLEARFFRRIGPVQRRFQAGPGRRAVHAFLDALTLFGIGVSWGGYESLAIPFDCTAVPHRHLVGAGRSDGAFSHRA